MDHFPRHKNPRSAGALTGLALSMMLSSLGTSVANVALPTLAQAFDATFSEAQWIVLAFLLAITTLIVSVGRLGDLVGRRRLLLGGILVFTLASALCGLSPTLWFLVAARALQGVGAAIMMALVLTFSGDVVPSKRTGSAMGLMGTMSALGTALGPSLGGLLISGLGWPFLFLVNVPLGIVAFFLVRNLPADNPPRVTKIRFDYAGTLILVLTLATYGLAMTRGPRDGGPLAFALLGLTVLGLGLFVLVESKAAQPLVRWGEFREPRFRGSLAMNVLVSTVMMATLVVGPFYLSGALGLNPALVGIVMAVGPVVSIVTGVPAGRLVDRLGAPWVVIGGLLGMMVGCLFMAMLPPRFGVAGYLAALVVLAPGYQLFQAANNTGVMKTAKEEQRGVISGMLNLSRNLGLITGASAMGALFAWASVDHPQVDAPTNGLQITFGIATLLVTVALVLAFLGRVPTKGGSRK